MIDNDLLKHRAEFARALRNKQYEVTDRGGLMLPKQKVLIRGFYTHNVNGTDERVDENVVPTEGLNHILSVVVNNGTHVTPWYMALFTANVTPLATWTAANFTANATESTSGTEGYSETVRQTYVPAAPSAGVITNAASKAAFTIATATSISIWGGALLSLSTKGGTTGTLLSAAAFSAARTLYAADVFNVGYSLTLTSS